MAERSFYYILISTLYGYIGLSYAIVNLLISMPGDIGLVYLGFFYFIGSGIGLALFLIKTNKKLKAHDSV